MVVDKVQTNLFFGLITLINFHLVFSVFSFWFVLLQRKDACLIALFCRDRTSFTSSYSSTSSSTSFIETSDSDFVRSMADMADNEGVVVESEEGRGGHYLYRGGFLMEVRNSTTSIGGKETEEGGEIQKKSR